MNKIETAKYNLLFYGMEYEAARERIEEARIDFGMQKCFYNEEEMLNAVNDCINEITKEEKYGKTIEILSKHLKKEKEPMEQAEILNTILELRKFQNNEYEVNN